MTKIAPGTVAVGYCHNVDVSAGFANSMMLMLAHEMTKPKGTRLLRTLLPEFSGVNVSGARNGIVRRFLETDAEWLLTIDSDMIFRPDVLERIVKRAHPQSAPIVGGLCFGTNNGELFPTLYGMIPSEDGNSLQTIRYQEYPRDELFRVVGTGAAFLLVHREALVKIKDANYSRVFPWFQETEFGTDPCSEDMTFCLRAGKLGIPIHVDTGVAIEHQKTFILNEGMYLEQREALLAWQEAQANGSSV